MRLSDDALLFLAALLLASDSPCLLMIKWIEERCESNKSISSVKALATTGVGRHCCTNKGRQNENKTRCQQKRFVEDALGHLCGRTRLFHRFNCHREGSTMEMEATIHDHGCFCSIQTASAKALLKDGMN